MTTLLPNSIESARSCFHWRLRAGNAEARPALWCKALVERDGGFCMEECWVCKHLTETGKEICLWSSLGPFWTERRDLELYWSCVPPRLVLLRSKDHPGILDNLVSLGWKTLLRGQSTTVTWSPKSKDKAGNVQRLRNGSETQAGVWHIHTLLVLGFWSLGLLLVPQNQKGSCLSCKLVATRQEKGCFGNKDPPNCHGSSCREWKTRPSI